MKERKKEKEKERKVYKGIMERNESKWRKIRSIEETLGILETEDKEGINVTKEKGFRSTTKRKTKVFL